VVIDPPLARRNALELSLPAYQPTSVPAYQRTSLTSLPAYQPTSVPAYQRTSLPAYQRTSLPALPASQRTSVPAYQRTSVPAEQPASPLDLPAQLFGMGGKPRQIECDIKDISTGPMASFSWAGEPRPLRGTAMKCQALGTRHPQGAHRCRVEARCFSGTFVHDDFASGNAEIPVT